MEWIKQQGAVATIQMLDEERGLKTGDDLRLNVKETLVTDISS